MLWQFNKTDNTSEITNVSASGGFLAGNTTFAYHLPSTPEYLENHAIKMNVAGGSVNVQYSNTRAQFIELVNASASAYTGAGTFCFFTATGNTRCTVTCSDRTVTYSQNGTIYNQIKLNKNPEI